MKSTHEILVPNEVSRFKTKKDIWNPYSWYKKMRNDYPVYYDTNQKVWNVFRYKDVNAVLSNPKIFSNVRKRSAVPIPVTPSRVNLNFSDAPQHRDIRSLVSNKFTLKNIENWRPRIQMIVDTLLLSFQDRQHVDITQEFAIPIPITVIANLLGTPTEDCETIKKWSDILFISYQNHNLNEIEQLKARAMKEFREYLLALILQKRYQPSDDIISDLTQAEYEGIRLTDHEIAEFSIGLLAAGNETTTNLITNSFYCFLKDSPSIYPELYKNPSLIPQAIEEVLRYRFTVNLDRTLAQDTNMLGVEMKKGEQVIAWVSAANLDERQFENADAFNIHRVNSKTHLTFGKGPHFCLGAPLARLESEIALTSFICKFSKIELDPTFCLETSLQDKNLKNLPINLKG